MRSFRNEWILAALVTVLLVAGCGGDGGPNGSESASPAGSEANGTLVIGIAGMVTPKEGLAYYSDLSHLVGERVGRGIRIVHKADYAEMNQLLKDAKVDMAYVCSGPYVAGHDDYGLELLAAPVVEGAPVYYAYIIVPRSSPATSIASLRGKSFAFTDPESNTGRIVPAYMLAQMGTTPEAFFGRTVYSYSHDNSIKLVADGEVDGAAVDSLIWDFADAEGSDTTTRTKVVTRSDPYPIPPVAVRPGLTPELKQALRDALLSAHESAEGRAILDRMHIERFVETGDSDYDAIREMNAWIRTNASPE